MSVMRGVWSQGAVSGLLREYLVRNSWLGLISGGMHERDPKRCSRTGFPGRAATVQYCCREVVLVPCRADRLYSTVRYPPLTASADFAAYERWARGQVDRAVRDTRQPHFETSEDQPTGQKPGQHMTTVSTGKEEASLQSC